VKEFLDSFNREVAKNLSPPFGCLPCPFPAQ
jgi:hypothetical protein